MRLSILSLAAVLGLSACAPRALYFHETTKVGFAADYNTSDSQPLATSFGFKRRIVAVVPSQEREIAAGGTERTGTNSGEALSLVSKFSVRARAREGIVISNNFASGMAARLMTRSVGSPAALNVLMHSAPIEVSAETGETSGGQPGGQAVNERLVAIKGKIGTGGNAGRPGGSATTAQSEAESMPPNGEVFRDPKTHVLMIRVKNVDGTVSVMPLSEFRKKQSASGKSDTTQKTDAEVKPADAARTDNTGNESGQSANSAENAADSELFLNAAGQIMRRIHKADGTVEEVPFKKP